MTSSLVMACAGDGHNFMPKLRAHIHQVTDTGHAIWGSAHQMEARHSSDSLAGSQGAQPRHMADWPLP